MRLNCSWCKKPIKGKPLKYAHHNFCSGMCVDEFRVFRDKNKDLVDHIYQLEIEIEKGDYNV